MPGNAQQVVFGFNMNENAKINGMQVDHQRKYGHVDIPQKEI